MAFCMNVPVEGGADTYYFAVPLNCRCIGACSVVTLADVATAAKTLTLSDGTTDIGVITIANSSTEGTMDSIVMDTTSLGKVALGPATPLKVVMAGSGNGKFSVALLLDEFHGAAT